MINLVKDFITEEEEGQILSHIIPSQVVVGTQRNRITRYGSPLPYRAPIVGAIPKWLQEYCSRLKEKGFTSETPDSVTINEYHKGQSIDWHIDSATSGPAILVLSLKTDAEMGLKRPDGFEEKLALPSRSLVIMTEDERWKWKHCIFPVSGTRFSIVFRKGTNGTLNSSI